MPTDPRTDVTVTDTQTKPATTVDTETDNDNSDSAPSTLREFASALLSDREQVFNAVETQFSISARLAVAGLGAYLMLLFGVAVLVSPLHTFGILSISTGVVILVTTYHPHGTVTISSPVQRYTYPAVGGAFILVGIRYLLTGVLFEYPFA